MEVYQEKKEFGIEEIAEAIGKTKAEVREMLKDSGSTANLRMLGCKVPKKDVSNLMTLHSEFERKLSFLFMG